RPSLKFPPAPFVVPEKGEVCHDVIAGKLLFAHVKLRKLMYRSPCSRVYVDFCAVLAAISSYIEWHNFMVMRMTVNNKLRVAGLELSLRECVRVEWLVMRSKLGGNPGGDLAQIPERDPMRKFERPFQFCDASEKLRGPKPLADKR